MKLFSKEETLKAKSIAILLLIFHHMYLSVDTISNNIHLKFMNKESISTIAKDARFCVWIFVFLSAYGMTITYYKWCKNVNKFFWHRILSLQSFCLPILLIYYVLAIVFKKTGNIFEKPYYILVNILGLSDMLEMPALGGGYWYINFTILLILFLPLFVSMCEKSGWTILPITIILFKYINSGIHSPSGGNYIGYLLAVEIGILFYQNEIWERICKISKKTLFLLFIPICTLIIYLPYLRNACFSEDIWSIKLILSTIPAVLVCIFTFTYCKYKPLKKVMIFLGKHSANMYLFHPLILSYLRDIVYISKNMLLSYFTCVALSIIASLLLNATLKITRYNDLISKLHIHIDQKFSHS